MSKIFYDSLLNLAEVEARIHEIAETSEEKEELWQLIDEIVHHRVLGCVLDRLPEEHHHEFLTRYHKCPYDESILEFIDGYIDDDIGVAIQGSLENLVKEILSNFKFRFTGKN